MAQNPDLALWRSVLVAGLSDAAKGRDPKDAAWLRSADFRLVCHLAGLDPDGVLRGNLPKNLPEYERSLKFLQQDILQ
jgi:hypothetical protein